MPNKHDIINFHSGRVLRAGKLEGGELWVASGKIVPPQQKADHVVDLQGQILAPGFIDIQINGGFGIDFSTTPEKAREVAQQLPSCGVTSFLPTVISSPQAKYPSILRALREAMRTQSSNESVMLGVHLEGPFFNSDLARAHDPAHLQTCEKGIETVYGNITGVKMVTLAPELVGSLQMIQELSAQGVVVSVGHSAANSVQLDEAIGSGVQCATHLFNAMPPFHHRHPGLVGAILTHPTLPFSIIADPFHIHAQVLKMIWPTHADRLILISDAMAGLGAPKGQLGSQKIEIRDGKAVVHGTDTIAGSTSALDGCVRYLWQSTGCSEAEALESASLKPAQLLNITGSKGTLAVGADADLIVLDSALHVQRCWIAGCEVPCHQ